MTDHKVRLIVLPGWFGTASSFDDLVQLLGHIGVDAKAMDYRGYGTRRGEAGTFQMAEIAQDALNFADRLNWQQFHVLGHSMGGMAMQRVALNAPSRVLSMIGVTPVPASGLPLDEATRGAFAAAANDDAVRAGIIEHSVSGRLPHYWVANLAARSRRSSDEGAFHAYGHAFINTDFALEAAELQIPLTVLVGECDPALNLPFLKSTFGQTYPQAIFELLNGAGHYPMEEVPLRLLARIEAHFVRLSA